MGVVNISERVDSNDEFLYNFSMLEGGRVSEIERENAGRECGRGER